MTGNRWTSGRLRLGALAVLAVVAIALVALDLASPRNDEPSQTVSPSQARDVTGEPLEYVALGDSLSRGVQPGPGGNQNTDQGYPRQLLVELRRELDRVDLVEAGCGAATTVSMMRGGACRPAAATPYLNESARTSQLAWAVDHIRSRNDRPTLVTLDIGGNDLMPCVTPNASQVTACLKRTEPVLARHWRTIAREIAAVAGPQTILAVATNYDPYVALLRTNRITRPAVLAFHHAMVKRLNPAIKRIFRAEGWLVADVGAAMGTTAPLHSSRSRAVSVVCDLTWMCVRGDVHLNDDGYQRAARVFDGVTRAPLARLDVRRSGG